MGRLFAALILPSIARADEGNWLAFGVVVLIVPTVIAFVVACLLVWFLVRPAARPLAIAIIAIPCAPVPNGSFYWPLWSYLLDRNLPGSIPGVVGYVTLSAVIAYGLAWLAVRSFAHRRPHGRTH